MPNVPDDLSGYTLMADHVNEKTYIVFFHAICGDLIPFERNRWDGGRNIDIGEAVAWAAAHRLVCKGIRDA